MPKCSCARMKLRLNMKKLNTGNVSHFVDVQLTKLGAVTVECKQFLKAEGSKFLFSLRQGDLISRSCLNVLNIPISRNDMFLEYSLVLGLV